MAGMLSAAVSTLNPRLVPFLADPSIVGTPIPLQQNGDSAAPTVDTAAVMAMAQTAEQRRAIFNSTIRVAGLALYTCHEQATAYSAALHPSLFASYRTFLFNRTYNPTGYTQAHCDSAAPETDEYFKCHAGEQLIVFGNLARASQPDRDGRDSGFARMVVDIWAAFARTGNPDISAEELRVRGFADTAERLARAGSWSTVKSERPMLRLFQWDGGMRDFSDVDACEKMGFGLKYFEDLKS